ncbi:hypothetical protein G3580_05750 [Nitrogeniibacter mangrovi]|uniref:DUF5666 domain-containing protein n=1 Tax=Nitrogeniibacter mangrovi TaxID=2016596 RepID=A0A6C1B4I6_9RHOO|nr:hypothetical protein [Nitrogeniibacter mangrovi]QID17190.1 hypothetical protein G3580_05750 [Nitrogeniibacter mangrovi]
MKSILRNAALGSLLATLALCSSAVHAQAGMTLPLEEVGKITAVSPATSTITVGKRKLLITSATRITADDEAMAHTPISQTWEGHQVGMETYETENGQIAIRQLHFFSGTTQ